MKIKDGNLKFNFNKLDIRLITDEDYGNNDISKSINVIIDELKDTSTKINDIIPEILKEPEELRDKFKEQDLDTSKGISNER